MIITRAWIKRYKTDAGGWTRKQLNAIGVSFPPVKGWTFRVVGREITKERQAIFERPGKSDAIDNGSCIFIKRQ